jgi:chemotaxis signal transduction protein
VSHQFVVFRAAGEQYALPLEAVREVIADAPRRGLPNPPAPWVVGLASVRGELMPVVDVGLRMGHAPAPPDRGVLIVVEARRRSNARPERAALAVERVDRLAEPEALTPAPAYAGDAADAIFEREGGLVVALEPAALLPAVGGTPSRRKGAGRGRQG